MSNESGLKPLGRCVLIEPYEPERKQSSIIMVQSAIDSNLMLNMRAKVIEVGPGCWPDEPPRAKPGDLVLVAKMSGVLVVGVKDDKQYRAVNDRDIFMGIEQGEGV